VHNGYHSVFLIWNQVFGLYFRILTCHCYYALQSYTMRNSVLGVLGEMILRVLSGEELDFKQKLTRDQFLDKLEVLLRL